MTDHDIEQLAEDIAAEVSESFQGFFVISAHCIGRSAVIRYRWRQPPVVDNDYTISLAISDDDTDESIKSEIRRQITNVV